MLFWFCRLIVNKALLLWFSIAVLFISVFVCVGGMVGYLIIYLTKDYAPDYLAYIGGKPPYTYMGVGVILLFVISNVIIFLKAYVDVRKIRKNNQAAMSLLCNYKEKGLDDISTLYSAENYQQLIVWLQNDDYLLNESHAIRIFSSFTLNAIRSRKKTTSDEDFTLPLCLVSAEKLIGSDESDSQNFYLNLRQILENRLARSSG